MAIVTSDPESVRARSQPESWQAAMKSAVRDPRQLCRMLDLPEGFDDTAERAAKSFPLFAPLSFIGRMKRGDPDDPLLRQVMPLEEELNSAEGFTADPLAENESLAASGLLHKYAGRALLITTGACAIHCRYCFRRHFPYHEMPNSIAAWQPALQQIAADDSIEEILLSGGDPLTLVDERLAELVNELASIPHLRRLRIHTRLPIVIPQRVTGDLLNWLTGTHLTPIVVLHANHPAEFGDEVSQSIARLADAGIMLLNQAVLLRGVNDDVEALAQLSRRLVDQRVMPYYLHQLDPVAGAAHFQVPVERGLQLIQQLRGILSGYAVPRFVREVPGESSKRILA